MQSQRYASILKQAFVQDTGIHSSDLPPAPEADQLQHLPPALAILSPERLLHQTVTFMKKQSAFSLSSPI